ncbi:hypothetical protein [Micromonospora lupini]|uniref:Uncharacterized protein n=1 Tax=Micromonospora lupini str. Lupac 08 TaxID=1150864 RepID=I0L7J5_9ACTN|nr:hypothetical protein [Micromonospora lupini]CCH19792.1 Protein of unknown function [Micromonospora lupini str. Lupac 08]
MTGYTELTHGLAALPRAARAVHGACCALRYVPVLTAIAPDLETVAVEYIDLITDHLGAVDDGRLTTAYERVDALVPKVGDGQDPDYWVADALSLVAYTLECARSDGSPDAANWVCSGALGIAAAIDVYVRGEGLTARLKQLDIAAQESSIRQLQGDFDGSTVARLRSESAVVAAEVETMLPVFLRALRP